MTFPFFQICHLKLPQGWINGSLQTCSLVLLFRNDFLHAARLQLLGPSHLQGPCSLWPGWQAASHTQWQWGQGHWPWSCLWGVRCYPLPGFPLRLERNLLRQSLAMLTASRALWGIKRHIILVLPQEQKLCLVADPVSSPSALLLARSKVSSSARSQGPSQPWALW